jgi:DNA topoisomerase VI subunit B
MAPYQDQTAQSFQPAKNQGGANSRVLQIASTPERIVRRKAKAVPKLTRVAFKVSRLMEFCSERELQNQTGHSVRDWPLVVGKEAMDNALDACEEAEVAPEIAISVVDSGTIIVQDNAGGIATETIESILDYSVRVSSREAYVSPTRGAQGNALKTILAMSYALNRRISDADPTGVTIIETRGIRHQIEFRVDHISSQPKIIHTMTESPVKVGTKLTINWPPENYALEHAKDRFQHLVEAYTWFNPHLTLRGVWCGHEFVNVQATVPAWEKWRPRDPTSAHWYDEARLQRYLAAHVARDRDVGEDRTVRDFLSEFLGLSGAAVQRRIVVEVGCSRLTLAQFFGVERVNRDGIAKLLAAMKAHSKPVNPKDLGIIGAEHFKQRFLEAGGEIETFKYECRKNVSDGIPYVVEAAFGLHQSGLSADSGVARKIVTGANWSAAIDNPFRRFGSTGEGLENTLAKVRANANQPVIFALHLASAYIQFADRGKSSIILSADNAVQPDD